ncbi:hypothetical protein ACH9EU_15450 [Kocuria sp. M1R5S2]|uniref:hypothetical protein n=1 Tax=Kocuria rhizosphaerae TaxID=3376285 RepID=UPI0037A0ECDE
MTGRPGGPAPGPEEEWARIVAGLEDVRRAGDRHLPGPRDWSPEEAPLPESAVPESAAGTADDDAPYSPDPGPVTQGLSGVALLAWTVLIGVPVLLVVLALLPGSLPWWAVVTGLVAVVVAIGVLLRRLPEERDDLDDGARV